jgi:hypothetical protein
MLKAGQDSLITKFVETVRFTGRSRILTDGVDYLTTNFGKKGNCIEQYHTLLDGAGCRTTKFDNRFTQPAGRTKRRGTFMRTVPGVGKSKNAGRVLIYVVGGIWWKKCPLRKKTQSSLTLIFILV